MKKTVLEELRKAISERIDQALSFMTDYHTWSGVEKLADKAKADLLRDIRKIMK